MITVVGMNYNSIKNRSGALSLCFKANVVTSVSFDMIEVFVKMINLKEFKSATGRHVNEKDHLK